MRLENVMVHVDTSPEAESRLTAAAALSRTFGARLIGVAAGQTSGGVSVERSNVLLAEVAEIEQLLDVAGERFARVAANLDGAEWRSDFADPSVYLARNARAADVVVVGPSPARSGLTGLSLDPTDALLEAGRPVLYLPAGVEAVMFERVLVAWKDCKEARRAVYEALPLLERAQAVGLIALNESGDQDGSDDVAAWLASHGVEADIESRPVRFGTVGEAILDYAAEARADLIVAGSFSRSRGQERVFGGVTLDLLARSPIPVLFAH